MYKKVALFALILILAIVNWSIYQKEEHIKNGKVIFLKLAPIDPRSLMQGDYMALRFDIARDIYNSILNRREAKDGFVLVSLDEKKVATFKSLDNLSVLKSNELLLEYRIRNGVVKFGSNAFFFQEGRASKYQKAKYGEFRVNSKGEPLLVAMADENLSIIK